MSSGRWRAYVASPLGFTESGRHYSAHVYLPALRSVVDVVDPWALTSAEEVLEAQATGHESELARRIGARNIAAIRASDVLVALLDGQEPDAGTVAEIGYATGLGRRCYGLRSDLRQSGEPGVPVNLQVAAFVAEHGGIIVDSLDALVSRLRRDSA